MKGMKIKKILMLPILCLTLMIFGNVNAETIPSTITIDKDKTSSDTDALYYITSKTGNWTDHIKSPVQYAIVNGESRVVYCFERAKLPYNPGLYADDAYTLNKISKLTPAGYIYIFENGYPGKNFIGDAKKDYYITQIALWWYQDLLAGTKDTEDGIMPASFKSAFDSNYDDPEGLYSYIKKLAHDAASASAPSVNLKLISNDFAYTTDYKKLNAVINVETNGTLGTPKVTKSANISSVNRVNTGSSYGLTVDVSAVNGMSGTVTFEIDATKTSKEIYLYKTATASPQNTDFQQLVVPFTIDLNTKKSLTLDLARTGIKINKVDEKGNTVKGATLRLTDSSDKLIKEWVTDGVMEIYDFKPGKVTLTEVKAPDGYITMEAITKEAKAGSLLNITAKNTRNLTSIIKLDENGNPLEGAKFELIDAGNNKYTWTSTTKPYVIEGAVAGKCTLKELEAPVGYALITENIPCEIKDNTTNEIKIKNSATVVTISKQDITTKEELPGATLVVKDSKGNQIDKWVSSETPHVIKGLIAGQKYTLEETIAPDGYALTSGITFEVDKNGKVAEPVVMTNEPITTKFYKKDSDTNEMLEGAILMLTDEDGNEIERWTTTSEPHVIKGLVAGKTYKLVEQTAPEGYKKAEDVVFTVDNKKVMQEVTMLDTLILIPVPDTANSVSPLIYVIGGLILLSGVLGTTMYLKKRKSE